MKKLKFKIVKDYKRCSNPALVSRATKVYVSIRNNPTFPGLPFNMDVVKQVIDQLEQCMVDAQHRDRLKSAQKNVVVVQLEGLLDQLADYVTRLANGDETILLASGFQVNSNANTNNSFGPVQNFTIELGPGSGNISVSVKRITGGTSYNLHYGIDNGDKTIWQVNSQSKSKYVVKGLQPGKTYVFRMVIVGTNEREVSSEIVTKIIG